MKRFLLFASILLFVLPFSGMAHAKINHTVTDSYVCAAIDQGAASPVITAGPAGGFIYACAGTASVSPNIQQFTVSGANLTGNLTAIAPAGFEISIAAGTGYSNNITLIQAGGNVSNTILYIRSAATAPAGNISGNVALTSPGASVNVAVSGEVNTLPVINPVPNQGSYLNGSTTQAINFTGTGNTFNWTNDTPGIGLPASGTGNIAQFIAVNKTNKPITATITAITVNNPYAYVANLGSNNVSVINTATNTVIATIPVGTFPNTVAISPDNSLIYVGNNTANNISVISAATNKVVATIPMDKAPFDMTISADGTKLYVVGEVAATLWMINTKTYAVIGTVALGQTSEGVAVSSDATRVYVTNANTSTVQVINTATYKIINNITVGINPIDVIISPDGKSLYVANQSSNTVSVVDIATSMVKNTIPVGKGPINLAVSPDGNSLYVANEVSNSVSVINTNTNRVVATISTGGSDAYGISLTPDGNFLYVVNVVSNDVSVINTSTNAVVTTIPVGINPYSWGSFITKGSDCTSTPVKFTITVSPASGITAGPVTGNISACAGTASANPDIQQFTVSGSNLTGNITASAPAGFEISIADGTGYSNNITLIQADGTVNSTMLYVRSAATAPAGNISGNVILTSSGTSVNVGVTGKVNGLPVINPVPNQGPYLNGSTTKAINFTGTGNTFNWVNDKPGIGLAASGTGDISSFTAVNTGSAPIVATITATPLSLRYAYITNSGNGTVSVVNVATNIVVATINVGAQPRGVSVSPDGSRVYVANSGSGNISVINTATNKVAATITTGDFPYGISVSPDGSRVYVANSIANTVSVINTATNLVIATINGVINTDGLIVSPDGSKVYVASSSGVTVIDTKSNTIASTIPFNIMSIIPQGLAISPDGSTLYVANTGAGNVTVINTLTGNVVNTIKTGTYPYGIAVSPDGSKVYETNFQSSTVSVISTATNSLITTIPVGSLPYGVSVSADGSIYVVQEGSNNVAVIDPGTNTISSTFQVGVDPIAFGNFISPGTGCSGTPVKFTITIDPTSDILTGAVTGSISACTGSASASPYIQQFTVSGSNLSGNITATAPAGFEISLSAGNGYSNSVMLDPDAGIVSSTILYVRSAASAQTGNIAGNVTLTSPGVASQTVAVTGTVSMQVSPSVSIAASSDNICTGTPVTFTATPTGGGNNPIYQWLLNGGNTGTNSATFTGSSLVNGDVISCIMTGNAACIAPVSATSNSITITVASRAVSPSVSITASANTICEGTPVTFTAVPVNGGSTPVYQWLLNGNDAGTNSPVFTGSSLANADIISCIMTSDIACATPSSATSNSITINVDPLPVVNSGGNKTIYAGGSVLLNATATGNIADITWSPATGLNNPKILNPVASPSSTTTYILTVQTTGDCTGSAGATVTVLFPVVIPNTFTPNGDGINDTWEIKHLDSYPNCTVKIYNRWGQNLYSSTGYGISWDGTYKGAALPSGTYYYIIDLKNNTKFMSGFVMIIR